jgi:hypothetical protein
MGKAPVPKYMKNPPEIKRGKCGDIGITLHPRGGAWSVTCLNPKCDMVVRGFTTELKAIAAWNEEVMKK